jgi:regulator of RNase E activity RraA
MMLHKKAPFSPYPALFHHFSPRLARYPFHKNPTSVIWSLRMTGSSAASKAQLRALDKYTACDIADALVKLKVPNAGFLADLKLFAPPSTSLKQEITIAPASTVIFVSKDGSHASDLPEANISAGQHWIDLTQPNTIVVMKQPEGQRCAVLGGIMALRMKALNAKGVVVSGRVRDVNELEETGLPVRNFECSTLS